MRIRKQRGKEPGAVTLTQDDIMSACLKFVEDQGFDVGNQMWLKIVKPKKDAIGRKRGTKVEVIIETK